MRGVTDGCGYLVSKIYMKLTVTNEVPQGNSCVYTKSQLHSLRDAQGDAVFWLIVWAGRQLGCDQGC